MTYNPTIPPPIVINICGVMLDVADYNHRPRQMPLRMSCMTNLFTQFYFLSSRLQIIIPVRPRVRCESVNMKVVLVAAGGQWPPPADCRDPMLEPNFSRARPGPSCVRCGVVTCCTAGSMLMLFMLLTPPGCGTSIGPYHCGSLRCAVLASLHCPRLHGSGRTGAVSACVHRARSVVPVRAGQGRPLEMCPHCPRRSHFHFPRDPPAAGCWLQDPGHLLTDQTLAVTES